MKSGLVERSRRVARGTVISVLVVGYIVGVGLAWAALTPMDGVPDEHSHIAYAAAVVRGDFGLLGDVDSTVYEQLPIVTVPEWIESIGYLPCFAFHPEVTADCAAPLGSSIELVPIPTSVTRYPPPYYWLVGLPSLFLSGAGAVYAMRVVSVLLAAGLIASGLWVASPSRRAWLALAVMVAFSPQAGHFVGSVNPTALEVAAALGLGIALVGTVGAEHKTRFVVVVAGLVFALAWARPMSFMTLGGVVVVGVLVNGAELRRRLEDRVPRRVLLGLVSAATLGVLAYDVLVRRPMERAVSAGVVDPDAPFGFVENLRGLPLRWFNWGGELVGHFGWGDHVPPLSFTYGWLLLGLVLVVIALAAGTRRQRLALAVTVFGVTVVAPLFVIQFVMPADRYQARYHLPLVTLIAVVAAVVVATSRSDRLRGAGWAVLRWGSLFTATAMLVSMAGSMLRYSIGGYEASMAGIVTFRFVSNLDWIPAAAMRTLAVGTVVLVVSAVLTFMAIGDTQTGNADVDSG